MVVQNLEIDSRLRWWDPQDILRVGWCRGTARVMGIWFGVILLSILAGLISVNWNGIALRFGPLPIDVTFYPPLTFCLLLTLWMGPFWGVLPAFVTMMVVSIHNGIPFSTSVVFSLATPIALTVLWSSMVMLRVSPSLRSWKDAAHFALLSIIATGASSVGALVWIYYYGLSFSKAQAVWEGWVLGDFLQIVLIVGPLLYVLHRRVQKWLCSQVKAAPRVSLETWFYVGVFGLVFVVMIAVGGAAGRLLLHSLTTVEQGDTISITILRITLLEARFFLGVYTVVFLAAIIVFSSTLGSQLERHLRDIAERKRVHEEHEKLIGQLQDALSRVKLLAGMLPICSNCKKVRDDKGYWNQIEEYVREHSEAEFSHGICPDCLKKLYPEIAEKLDSGT